MLSNGWVEQTVLHQKNGAGWDFAQKLQVQLDFQENLFSFLSVSFHHEMFDLTSFRLFLGVCIVHVVIFIKKHLVNLFSISFCELLKILVMIILKNLKKLCHASFFKFDKKKCKLSKQTENITGSN